MAIFRVNNKYNIYLFLLILSTACGMIGGAFAAPRILTLFFLPALLKVGGIKNRYISPIAIFFLLLYLYGLFSLLWTPDLKTGAKEAVYLPIHMLFFIEIICFSRQCANSVNIIVRSWIMAVLLTSVVAVWEITTDNHLAWSKIQDVSYLMDYGTLVNHHFASVTFGNYNTYVTFLAMSLPFILYAVYQGYSNKMKWAGFLTIAAIVYILSANASRGGLICLGIDAMIVMLYILFQKTSKGKGLSLFILGLLIIGTVVFYEQLSYAISLRLQGLSMVEDNSRRGLYHSSIGVVFGDYYGMGAGMGGGYEAMHQYRKGSTLWAFHNFFLEFLVNYGILFLSVLLYLLFRLFSRGIKIKCKSYRLVLVSALVTLLPLSVIDSSYLDSPFVWAYYASLFVFVYYECPGFISKKLLQTA